MPLQPRILKNCMVYMDGDFLLGGHEECELPELSLNTEDYRGGGMDAPVKIDMGMEALECSITFKERRASDLKLFGLTLFGDVPISVIVPPMIDRYDSGIISLEAETFIARASCMKTGIITTTKGVLFMKADIATTPSAIAPRARTGDVSAAFTARAVAQSSAPVRTRAPTMMNIAAIVQGAALESTFTASACGRMPSTSISAAPPRAVTSTGKTSRTNRTSIPARIAMAAHACASACNSRPNITAPRLRSAL